MSHLSFPPYRRAGEKFPRFVQQGNLRRVKRALAGGADIDGADIDLPPLVLGARLGLFKMVKLLLRRGADVNAAVPHDTQAVRLVRGTTAVHMAVYHCWIDVVRLLLRSGGNPNAVDSEGFTPLHLACDTATIDAMVMATALFEAGANPLLGDADDEIAIHFAAGLGHIDVLDLVLLKAPSTLNRPSSKGFTPLWLAVMNDEREMILHLLRLGAKQPVELDTETASPLVTAVEENHDEVLRILVDNGMDAVGSSASIASAMRCAVRNGRAKSLHALLRHFDGGEDTRQSFAPLREDGFPLLHLAVRYGHLATVSVLLAAGADETTAVDRDGRFAHEVVGSEDDIDPATEVATVRMLTRGPAFRAASWRWRAGDRSPVGVAGGSVAYCAGGRDVRPLGVRIFRLKCKNTCLGLVCRFGR